MAEVTETVEAPEKQLEDGEIADSVLTSADSEISDTPEQHTPGAVKVPSPPSKRRKYGDSLGDQSMDNGVPRNPLLRSSNIVWVDLEMTGLDIDKDYIMEMACIVTDRHLNIVAEGPNLVIHHTDEVLNNMGEWCTAQHKKTGLTQQCRDSQLSCRDVEERMIEFVSKYCPKGRCELAGNSIHCDRRFLLKYMPEFLDLLHYRIIDVSTIRNVASRWYRNFERYKSNQQVSHRALDDIRSSITELQYYKDTVFKSPDQYTNDLGILSEPEAFDSVLNNYEASMKAHKMCVSDEGTAVQDEQKKEEEGGGEVHRVEPRGPVNVSVNGKNITLFGN